LTALVAMLRTEVLQLAPLLSEVLL